MTHHRETNWTGIVLGFFSVAAALGSSAIPLLEPLHDYFLIAVAVGNAFLVHPTRPKRDRI